MILFLSLSGSYFLMITHHHVTELKHILSLSIYLPSHFQCKVRPPRATQQPRSCLLTAL